MFKSLGRMALAAGLSLGAPRVLAQEAPRFAYPTQQDTHAAALEMLERGYEAVNDQCPGLVPAHLVDLGTQEDGRAVRFYTEGRAPDHQVKTEENANGVFSVRYSTFSELGWSPAERLAAEKCLFTTAEAINQNAPNDYPNDCKLKVWGHPFELPSANPVVNPGASIKKGVFYSLAATCTPRG